MVVVGFDPETYGLQNSRLTAELPKPMILDILIVILQDKTLFGALEASNIVCWLVNQPIAKLDLFKSPDCRWIWKTYVEYCYRNSATVRRLVQSPTLQSTIFCGVHSDLRSKGIRVSPACRNHLQTHLPWHLRYKVCIYIQYGVSDHTTFDLYNPTIPILIKITLSNA